MIKTILLHDEIQFYEMIEDEVKKRILQEGYPLQRFCAKKLQNLGWTVSEEYPVEQILPISNNPYGGIEGDFKQIRTSGDIRAIHPNVTKGFAICVCISCKRQLKIDWSFMKAMFSESSHTLITNVKTENNVIDYIFDLQDKLDDPFPLCNIPTNLNHRKEDVPREEDKIVKTSENLFLETLQSVEDDVSWLRYDAPYKQIIYIPVIVTAAKIHAYDIDEKKFDISNTDSIDIQEVNFLMYQHHLPRSMHKVSGRVTPQEYITSDKFNIFVVNYQHFEDFIKKLMKKFEDHPM